MQIKATLRYHCLPITLAKIQSMITHCTGRALGENKYCHIHVTVTTSVKDNLTICIKIVSATFFGPAIPLLGIYPTDTPAYAQNDICTRLLNAAFL